MLLKLIILIPMKCSFCKKELKAIGCVSMCNVCNFSSYHLQNLDLYSDSVYFDYNGVRIQVAKSQFGSNNFNKTSIYIYDDKQNILSTKSIDSAIEFACLNTLFEKIKMYLVMS